MSGKERLDRIIAALARRDVWASDWSRLVTGRRVEPQLALHEAAHALDLGLSDWRVESIGAALLAMDKRMRRAAEVTASAVPFVVYRRLRLKPVDDVDAWSARAAATARNQHSHWSPARFAADVRAAMGTPRVREFADLVLLLPEVPRG